jgi:excisionase family DNA binding protein
MAHIENAPDRPLLYLRQVVKRFPLSRHTLYKMIAAGQITEYRTIGGHRRYDEDEILEALKQPVKKEDD